MINYDYIAKENIERHDPNWLKNWRLPIQSINNRRLQIWKNKRIT